MTEQELRQLVRDAIARHGQGGVAMQRPAPLLRPVHPSHGLLVVASGDQDTGACVIEPAVPCNHCGYCKSYGH
jgi:hypothetical protein